MNARERFDELVGDLASTDGTRSSTMFGMPCIKVGTRAFAGLYHDEMLFKLTGATHARALALEGARLFEPMEGRPMREWVLVPETHGDHWEDLARAAMRFARG
jgi:hypothetical protein